MVGQTLVTGSRAHINYPTGPNGEYHTGCRYPPYSLVIEGAEPGTARAVTLNQAPGCRLDVAELWEGPYDEAVAAGYVTAPADLEGVTLLSPEFGQLLPTPRGSPDCGSAAVTVHVHGEIWSKEPFEAKTTKVVSDLEFKWGNGKACFVSSTGHCWHRTVPFRWATDQCFWSFFQNDGTKTKIGARGDFHFTGGNYVHTLYNYQWGKPDGTWGCEWNVVGSTVSGTRKVCSSPDGIQ